MTIHPGPGACPANGRTALPHAGDRAPAKHCNGKREPGPDHDDPPPVPPDRRPVPPVEEPPGRPGHPPEKPPVENPEPDQPRKL